MAQGTLPGFISALRAGLRPVALRNGLRASRAHPSFPFPDFSGFIDSLKAASVEAALFFYSQNSSSRVLLRALQIARHSLMVGL